MQTVGLGSISMTASVSFPWAHWTNSGTRSLERRMNKGCASGSPKRTLNSRTFGCPCSIISPP